MDELEAYFDKRYEPGMVNWWTPEKQMEMMQRYKNAAEFRRKSKELVYLDVHLERSQWRRPYLEFVREVAQGRPVLDYECGTGGRGLQLLSYGYEVSFADVRGECVKFLKWRLKRRELEAKVYDLDKDQIPRSPVLMCLDRIHQRPEEQQWNFIQLLATLGETVIINLNECDLQLPGYYWSVDVAGLREHIMERFTVIRYKVVNAYAHLLAFRTPEPEPQKDEIEDGAEIEAEVSASAVIEAVDDKELDNG